MSTGGSQPTHADGPASPRSIESKNDDDDDDDDVAQRMHRQDCKWRESISTVCSSVTRYHDVMMTTVAATSNRLSRAGCV